jgi:hypothetical protein
MPTSSLSRSCPGPLGKRRDNPRLRMQEQAGTTTEQMRKAGQTRQAKKRTSLSNPLHRRKNHQRLASRNLNKPQTSWKVPLQLHYIRMLMELPQLTGLRTSTMSLPGARKRLQTLLLWGRVVHPPSSSQQVQSRRSLLKALASKPSLCQRVFNLQIMGC